MQKMEYYLSFQKYYVRIATQPIWTDADLPCEIIYLHSLVKVLCHFPRKYPFSILNIAEEINTIYSAISFSKSSIPHPHSHLLRTKLHTVFVLKRNS